MHHEGQIYLMDFGTAKYLEDGVVHDDFGCHNPWGYGPEAYHDKEYTFNADVYHIGNCFSDLASYDGDRMIGPLQLLFGKDKEIWANGIDGAFQAFRKLMKTEKELTWVGADRYGPDFEKLLAGMMAYDPQKRLSAAEVVKACKDLK
jgi:serine/threonine protein kinase